MEKETLLGLSTRWKDRWKNKKWNRIAWKLTVICLIAVSCLVGYRIPALAASETRKATLTLEAVYDTNPLKHMTYKIYHAAKLAADGRTYVLTDLFTGCGEDISTLHTAGQWREAAIRMDVWAKQNEISGLEETTGEDGKVVFSGLEPGIYLIGKSSLTAGSSVYTSETFLVELPSRKTDGTLLYEVSASPKIERTQVPDEPETRPSQPETSPSQPETSPSQPETRPSQPETRPSYTRPDRDHGNENASSDRHPTIEETRSSVSGDQQTSDQSSEQSEMDQNQEKLPQTGQMKWPIPCLLLIGIVILLLDRIVAVRKQKNSSGNHLFLLGILFLCGALGLQGYNLLEENKAERYSEVILPELERAIGAEKEEQANELEIQQTTGHTAVFAVNYEGEAEEPVVILDGTSYLGYLEVPELDLTLPVREHLSYPALKETPCHYSGTVDGGGLVIAAHNYKRHFGQIGSLKPEDVIYFTDGNGIHHEYRVSKTEILEPEEIEEMISNQWDLTLFTCTYGGSKRIAVRCQEISA